MRVTADGRVRGGHTFSSVDDQQCNVRGLQVLARHHHRELLCHKLSLTLAADAGRVDEAQTVAVTFDNLVHRIASRARDWRNNGARASRELIQQRRFPDIWTTNDCDLYLGRAFRLDRKSTRLIYSHMTILYA